MILTLEKMSIIYNALKKAQKSLTSFPKPIINSNIRKNSFQNKPSNKKYILIILSGIVLGIFGIRFAIDKSVLRLSITDKNNKEETIAKIQSQEDIKSTPQAQSNTTTTVTTPPSFILNGIVVSDSGNAAIVNGRIVDVGDKIEGAIVKKISAQEVTIDFQGQEIILK